MPTTLQKILALASSESDSSSNRLVKRRCDDDFGSDVLRPGCNSNNNSNNDNDNNNDNSSHKNKYNNNNNN
jgi:hypothetical protein